jgi:hypothetical protein
MAQTQAKIKATKIIQADIVNSIRDFSTKQITHYKETNENAAVQLALAPVWIFNTFYKNKNYIFTINGQTGEAVGKFPISIKKLILYSGITFAISQLLFFCINYVL